jgi:hypothetical protein
MKTFKIDTKEEYDVILLIVDRLMDTTYEVEEIILDYLVDLIEEYEEENFPM